jgi:hypothetical protein
MGKHVNADATDDETEAAAAADGTADGAHHGAARHSAEAGEPLDPQPATSADTPQQDGVSGVDGDVG